MGLQVLKVHGKAETFCRIFVEELKAGDVGLALRVQADKHPVRFRCGLTGREQRLKYYDSFLAAL